MSRWMNWIAGLVLAMAAPVAQAADKPIYGPPPAWVEVLPIPDAPPPEGAAAIQTLLEDNQSRLGPDDDVYYNRRVRKVLKAEGLRGMTTFGLTWQPAYHTLTIHTLRIVRGGETIDLLQGGAKMLVLRRERNLEAAMLDGRMSANQQLEGVQVGDIVDMAWTMSGRDPVLGPRSYNAEGYGFAGQAARYRMRVSVPAGDAFKWKLMPGFPQPKVTQRDGRIWLEVDESNVTAPRPPIGAPLRFRRLGAMETSSYASWSDLSKLMAPLYIKAAALPSDSPLKAEAKAIAIASTDPKARAFAALRLVEEKTRYFFIGIGDGGYVPANADETWRRRFGDCKAKTALLLALLKELKIDAEPALVSLGAGDGLDERLPSAAAFNHVIVKATVGGKVYWLDGTRTGDKSGLDALRPPPHRWALPIRVAGADLMRIDEPPLDAPVQEQVIRLDASKGIATAATATMTWRYMGDRANGMRQVIATQGRTEAERNLRQNLSRGMSWLQLQTIEFVDRPDDNAFEIRFTGNADLDWRKNPDLGVLEYKVDGGGAPATFPRREPGPNSDAPFAVAYPNFTRNVVEVVLPEGGKGFSVRGPSGPEKVGPVELTRSAELKAGVARFVADLRSTAPEIPASEAEAASRQLRRIAAEESLIRAPGATPGAAVSGANKVLADPA